MNSHARFAAHTAKALGYVFRSLDGADCYLFEVRDGARKASFSLGYATPYALNRAHAYGLARDKDFSQRVLREAGLPTIPSQVFFANTRQAAHRSPGRELEDAVAWSRTAAYPIFVKPNQGSKGEFAEIVANADQFADYFVRVAPFYDVILVQPLLRGAEHRVIVLHGEALFAYRKRAPELVGDGARTLRALMVEARKSWKPTALAQPIEAQRARDDAGALVPHETVLPKGMRVTLEGRANRAAGGDADEVIAAPTPLATLACKAAEALGLAFAGVDVFDLSSAGDLSELVLIEVNANPAIETLESQGRYDLIERVWAANFEAAFA